MRRLLIYLVKGLNFRLGKVPALTHHLQFAIRWSLSLARPPLDKKTA